MAPKRYFEAAMEEAPSSSVGTSTIQRSNATIPSDAKGKRKERGEPAPQTTLFVSSLPFTATSTDLSTLFSDIGPLRRAFVVTDKETGKSKGVGYVTFAILEDAQRAEQEMQGKSLDGKRKMRIEWAEKKAFGGRKKVKVEDGDISVPGDEDDSTTPKKTLPKPVREKAPGAAGGIAQLKDKDAVRTIILTGLESCQPAADDKTIYKRARKIGDVESVVYPAPLSIMSTDLSKDVAYVIYRTPNHAMTAVEKLHAHTFKGAQISVVLKKRADGVAKLEARMRPETKEKRERVQKKIEEEREKVRVARDLLNEKPVKGADVNRGSRLIIRNLPFDVTDRDLRAVFLPYGPIYSIDVPQKVGSSSQSSGDAKIATEEAAGGADSESESESEAAMEEDDEDEASLSEEDQGRSSGASSTSSPSSDVQGEVEANLSNTKETVSKGRGFAFVWMVSRADATNAIKGVNGTTIGRGAAERAQLKAAKGKAGRDTAKKALEEALKSSQPGRQVAVDWALSKKDWELKKDESEAEETDKEGEASEVEEDDSDLDPVEADKSEDEDEEGEDEEKDEDAKPKLPSPSEETTLFIRNLPYQATETELRDVFRTFGPLRYAKVTMDKATKRAKGTGFVCFWQKESADNALRQASLVDSEVGGTSTSTFSTGVAKVNPFSARSVLTADPSAPLTSSLSLHGRVLSVTLAVERDTAETLANKNKSSRDKQDKRNTYLMREGVPLPGTTLASLMSEKDKEKRLANFSVRKTQMSKNPSLFISKTRLSVRQLPLYASNKILKRLAIYAAREFDSQVKRGERVGLTSDELEESQRLMKEMQKSRSGNDGAEGISNKKMKKFVGERSTAVIQSKVMLQNDRVDPITGLGRSRGYGFLEMRSFGDSLKVVRFLNGDKSLGKLMVKWYADELEGMVKGLERDVQIDNAEQEERQSRLKRVQKKLEEVKRGQVDTDGEVGGRGGSIMVEFSIENVVVTKKRKERADHSQAAAFKRSRHGEGDETDHHQQRPSLPFAKARAHDRMADSDSRPAKRMRPETWNQKTTKPIRIREGRMTTSEQSGGEGSMTAKVGPQMGSLIGRKRKERKGRK